MERAEILLQIFPQSCRRTYLRAAEKIENLQEIRIRAGRPVLLYSRGREYFLAEDGEILYEAANAYRPDQEYLEKLLGHVCGYSAYAYEEDIRRGFLTVPGGHRIGIAGHVVLETGDVQAVRNISSINIRIAHEIKGAADRVLPCIRREGRIYNTLIISPPGCGKTTLLRDLIRQLSEGNSENRGMTIGVVDERSEIGGSCCGSVQNDLGSRTDLLDACPKAVGMSMLLRSMNPEVIAVDEIGGGEDIAALEQAVRCGTGLIATVHGDSLKQLMGRPQIKQLLADKVFERYILLKSSRMPGVIREICNADYQELPSEQGGGTE